MKDMDHVKNYYKQSALLTAAACGNSSCWQLKPGPRTQRSLSQTDGHGFLVFPHLQVQPVVKLNTNARDRQTGIHIGH